jgi:hypothetical protein
MKKCICGAIYHVSHPFGMKGKARILFSVEHDQNCSYKKKYKRIKR